MNRAFVGASTIAGQYLVGAIRTHPGSGLCRVVSGSADRAAAFPKILGMAQSSTDPGAGLADPATGAVYILSTNEKHPVQAMAANSAGKHVLCKRPLATGDADARDTVHAAERASVVFATKHHLRSAGTGPGQGVEDSAMSVWVMQSGAMVVSHESFTPPFAASGLEVRGTEGLVLARGVLSHEPNGEIDLVTAQGTIRVDCGRTRIYAAVLQHFEAAVTGTAQPVASGRDGLKSLQIAAAVRTAAGAGHQQSVNYGEPL